MKKFFSIFKIAILLIILIVSPFFIFKPTTYFLDLSQDKQKLEIIKLWHCETFEGGSMSRVTWLKNVAKEYEKAHPNQMFFIRTIEPEQLIGLLEKETPDLLSFGYGIDKQIISYLSEINEEYDIFEPYLSSVKTGGKLFALPYLASCYVLCTANSNATNLEEQKSILVGNDGFATPKYITDSLKNTTINDNEKYSSYIAYTKFRKDDSSPLLGTMRDVARLLNVFSKMNITYNFLPLSYTNLLQYISITNVKKYDIAKEFLRLVFSKTHQQELNKYGLFSTTLPDIYTIEPYHTIEKNMQTVKIENIW